MGMFKRIRAAAMSLFVDQGSISAHLQSVQSESDRPRTESRARPLKEDIAAYGHDLARRQLSRDTQRKRRAIVDLLIEKTEAKTIEHIDQPAVMDFLSARCRESEWGAKTHDNHVDSLKDFGRFLKGRYPTWPDCFAGIVKAQRVKPLYGGADTGVRAYTPAESAAIVAAAAKICTRNRARGKRACNRDWCYELFHETGLRHEEMCRLPWSVVFDDDAHPHIKCEASWTKSRRYEELPLTPRACEILRMQREHTGNGAVVFPTVPSWNMLNRDMARADVAKVDRRGRAAAFHSFRKELNTEAGKAGLPIDARMRLMRHTDPRLTLGTYSDLQRSDLAALLAKHLGAGAQAANSGQEPHGKKYDAKDLTSWGHPAEHQGGRQAGPLPVHFDDRPSAGPLTPRPVCQNPSDVNGPALSDRHRVRPLGGRAHRYRGSVRNGFGGSNPPLSACSPCVDEPVPQDQTNASALVDALIIAALTGVLDALHRIRGSASHESDRPT